MHRHVFAAAVQTPGDLLIILKGVRFEHARTLHLAIVIVAHDQHPEGAVDDIIQQVQIYLIDGADKGRKEFGLVIHQQNGFFHTHIARNEKTQTRVGQKRIEITQIAGSLHPRLVAIKPWPGPPPA